MRFLLVLFVVLPILEIWVLLEVGGVIGVAGTVALVILTALVGSWLLRQQGLATVLRARERVRQGEAPAREMMEGLLLAVGGILLLTPGFITDAFGLVCLLPLTRRALVNWALKLAVRVSPHAGFTTDKPSRDDSHTIEGEFHRDDDPRR